jgi:hypothetical protein
VVQPRLLIGDVRRDISTVLVADIVDVSLQGHMSLGRLCGTSCEPSHTLDASVLKTCAPCLSAIVSLSYNMQLSATAISDIGSPVPFM